MRKLILINALFLLSCTSQPVANNASNLFDLPKFHYRIIDNLIEKHSPVDKLFILNDVSEQRSINKTDSIFWLDELSVLLTTDLNSPRYRGQIIADVGLKDSVSNLLINRYRTVNSSLSLKELDVYYLTDLSGIRIIKLKLESKNFISSSQQEVTAWFNQYSGKLLLDSIVTLGKETVVFQNERSYESHIQRVRK